MCRLWCSIGKLPPGMCNGFIKTTMEEIQRKQLDLVSTVLHMHIVLEFMKLDRSNALLTLQVWMPWDNPHV